MSLSLEKDSCVRCGRQGRPRWYHWLVRPICADTDDCNRWERLLAQAPPAPDPYDPDALRPDDIAVCATCRGGGEVQVRQDWATGAIDTEVCHRCSGLGRELPW